MVKEVYGLIFSLICGLSFLIGIFVYNKIKNKERLNKVSIACASVIIIGLILLDILPELIEMRKWWLLLFVLLGLAILMILDVFIPNHTHHHKDHFDNKEEHKGHINHIGTITIIALLLHNMVEAMALYSVTNENLKSGILMTLAISLHNLPFGFQIAGLKRNNKHNKILILALVLSGFIGGLTIYLFGDIDIFIEGIIIAITLGMLLHILVFELIKEVVTNIKKKETIYGIMIGIVILVCISLI